MNILITGCNGQLGSELTRILTAGQSELGTIPLAFQSVSVRGVDIDTLDIADNQQVQNYFKDKAFDVVFNCAAMTNVDKCESEMDAAYKANVVGAGNIAAVAEMCGAKLIHVSTDYVFDGNGNKPYVEWDQTVPNTAYGKSKLLGEQYAQRACKKTFIVRTAWLYGYVGNNFVKTILRAARDGGALKVVDDQRGNPTNAADLAHHLLMLAASDYYGTYHCTGNGECSWFEFTKEIILLAGISCELMPCTTEEFPRPAPRPAYSALDNLALRCTVGDQMRPWQAAIAAYMTHYNQKSGEIAL